MHRAVTGRYIRDRPDFLAVRMSHVPLHRFSLRPNDSVEHVRIAKDCVSQERDFPTSPLARQAANRLFAGRAILSLMLGVLPTKQSLLTHCVCRSPRASRRDDVGSGGHAKTGEEPDPV